MRNRLGLDFKGKFHAASNGDEAEERVHLEKESGEGGHMKGRNPGTVLLVEVTATVPPWFVRRAQNLTGGEVSST